MSFAIETTRLGKRYRIRPGAPAGSRMLREDAMGWLRALLPGAAREPVRDVWAVREVELQVRTGEVLGLIGHNGAGKSTLLRLLSRITPPTEGHARVRGRVGTLLEVGTGFHAELTGRENVFLCAAVLGMQRGEVQRRLPAIVEMAGVGDYFEVPVKRYSTGMFVRLAFAVAAQLEPEIMLIDEILAVGDAEFRKRCLDTIDHAVRDGRTVVFVSHNAAAVERVCSRVAYLARGRVELIGTAAEALRRYHEDRGTSAAELSARADREGSGEARVSAIELLDAQGAPLEAAVAGAAARLCLRYACAGAPPLGKARLSIAIRTHVDMPVCVIDSAFEEHELGELSASGTLSCTLPRTALPPSSYRVSYALHAGERKLDALADAFTLRVLPGDFYRSGRLPDAREAVCLMDGSFEHER